MPTRFIALLAIFILLCFGLAAHAAVADVDGFPAQPTQAAELSMSDEPAGGGPDTRAEPLAADDRPDQNHAEHFLDIEAVPALYVAATHPTLTPDRPLSPPIKAPAARYLDRLQRPPSQATLQA